MPAETFSDRFFRFLSGLPIPGDLPDRTELLYPYDRPEVRRVMKEFYTRYYGDDHPRVFLIGINPGRFGGGVTGIPFTDPVNLAAPCGIENSFPPKHELSSRFIYDMIGEMGGPEAFFSRFFLTALSPLGFVTDGKNRNYYDTPALWETLKPWIVKSFQQQIRLGARRETAFSLGQGKNFRFLSELNREFGFFNEIIPLPHPRWIMQYKLKRKDEFLNLYKDKLNRAAPPAVSR